MTKVGFFCALLILHIMNAIIENMIIENMIIINSIKCLAV